MLSPGMVLCGHDVRDGVLHVHLEHQVRARRDDSEPVAVTLTALRGAGIDAVLFDQAQV